MICYRWCSLPFTLVLFANLFVFLLFDDLLSLVLFANLFVFLLFDDLLSLVLFA